MLFIFFFTSRCPTTAAKTEISSTAASPVPPFVQLIPPFIKSCHQVIEQSLWVCILVKISAYLASLSHIHATWSTTSLSHIKHAEENVIITSSRFDVEGRNNRKMFLSKNKIFSNFSQGRVTLGDHFLCFRHGL